MNIAVDGLGMVSRSGAIADLAQILTQAQINPNILPLGPVIPLELPTDSNSSPQLVRRLSHFAKLAWRSAYDAIRDSGIVFAGKSVGIIQGSVYGPIISGLQSFNDLIDYGDNQLSPTNFSGSVFNTAATYLSLAFDIQGPTLTHTSGLDTLYNSLLTASLWLESKTVDYVIMGIGDEYTPFFKNNSFNLERQTGLLPTGEGWTTFILSNDEQAKYGKIEFGYLKNLPEANDQKYLYSVWHEEINNEEFLKHAHANQACFPGVLRGSYPSAAAFDLALALVCAKYKRFPVSSKTDKYCNIKSINKNEPVTCFSAVENDSLVYYGINNVNY